MSAADSGVVDFAQNATLGGLTGSRSLNMDGYTVSVGNNGTDSTYSGSLFNGALTKVGSGTLTLTGTSTYSGATTINAGALRIGDGGTAGALPSATSISGSSGASLIFNRADSYGGAYAGVIGGNMGVRLASGTLMLTGSNTYGGATTINAGILQIGDGGTTGALSTSSAITGSVGGVFAVNRSDTVTQGTEFNSQITGPIGVTQLGSGTLVLTGGVLAANSYTGGTRISNGTLQLGSSKGLPLNSAVTLGTGITSGILDLAAFEATLGSLAFDGTGSQVVPNGKLNLEVLSGSAAITVNSGSHAIHPDTSLLSNTVVTMAANSFLSLHGVIDGAGSLRQVGSGTVSIYGANTYEGGTFLDGGYMSVESASALGIGGVTISGNSILNLNNHVITNPIVFGSGSGAVINAGTLVSVSGTYSITSGTGSEITTNYSVEADSDISFVSDLASTVYVLDTAVTSFTADVLATGDVNVNAGGRGIFSGGVAGNVLTTGSSLFAGGVTGNVTVQGGTANFTTTTGSVSAVNVNDGLAVFTGTIGGVAHATAAGATLEIRGPVLSTADVNAEAGGTVKLMGNGSFAGPTLDNDGTVIVDRTADLVLAALIGGTGSLVKSDARTLTLSGNNSYSGGTLVSGGTIQAGSATALGTGAVVLDAGVLNINGQSLSIGALSGSASTSVISSVAGPASLTTQVTGNSAFAGVIGDGAGVVSLTKAGAGKLTLTAANTFTGATVISGGTLALDAGASLASSFIKAGATANDGGTLDVTGLGSGLTLASGQKLGGYGTVLGDTLIGSGATVSPGGSIGALTQTGSMTWAGGGHYLFEITNANGSTPGTDWDLLTVDLLGITASVANKFVIDLQTLATGTAQVAGLMPGVNWSASTSYQWMFLEATSTTFSESNFDAGWFQLNSVNFLNDTTDGVFSVARGGEGGLGGDTTANQLYIVYAAVPEPGTLVLAGIGLAAAAWTLRHRRRRLSELKPY